MKPLVNQHFYRSTRGFEKCACWGTRPGRREDEGDIHALNLIWQVKDVAQPRWRDWLHQLHQQTESSPYQHGVLVWKLRGYGGKPPKWLAVMELDPLAELLARTER
ncbi:hypothetical protein [Lawsonella clevelandensis]|uniref:hypothetical protein n=1 Tax=Lawsonella clevelandensis TaxID=1528099 RepID=UPI00204FAC45|nr:hypothetical protein [Lawsonella clevelandensis]MDU7194114.1 hypothetical protein [Lawsonella clevelandensis]DAX25989.1 MAG TPA: HOLLIDAY JUNCTION RESOLVASE HOMOLOGOUS RECOMBINATION [Caudoviricetes sp.]